MSYWEECIDEALNDAGIEASKEQIELIASWVEGAHENYGMAHGHDVAHRGPDPEIKRLRKELSDERNKILCADCNGQGWITTLGPYHSGTSQCSKCRGEGRHLP